MSPIVNGFYLAQKEDNFFVKSVKGKIYFTGKYFEIDMNLFKTWIKKSKLIERELVLRVLEINKRHLGCFSDDTNKRKSLNSRYLMSNYYLTNLFLNYFFKI